MTRRCSLYRLATEYKQVILRLTYNQISNQCLSVNELLVSFSKNEDINNVNSLS